jgi:hypothetical protein
MQEVFSKSQDHMSGLTGTTMINGTTAVTGAFQSFYINSDAVIAEALDKDGVNITAIFKSEQLNRGGFWSMAQGNWFRSIRLTSGSLFAYGVVSQ